MHAFRINVAIRHFASDEISVTLNDFCSDINLSWQWNFNWIFEKILAYLVFGNFELAKMSSFQGMITFWGLPRLAERLSAPWIEKNSTSITMLKTNLVEYFGLSDPDLLLNKKNGRLQNDWLQCPVQPLLLRSQNRNLVTKSTKKLWPTPSCYMNMYLRFCSL